MAQPASQKKASQTSDWHPADIKAALAKVGWSLRQLALHHQVHRSIPGKALAGPYPKSERMIAGAIGVKPQVIWPSRYDSRGNPNRPRGRRPMRPAGLPTSSARQGSTAAMRGNAQSPGAA